MDNKVLNELENILAAESNTIKPQDIRLGAPALLPSKIICLAKNYREHAEEFDGQVPDAPIFFSKASSAVTGPFDPVILPPNSNSVDWEAELVVVIGQLVPHFHGMGLVDYPHLFTYMPSMHEVAITLGGMGLCALLFLMGERMFRGHLSEDH